MHVFVTGAGGYLGSGILTRLVADGHHVVALARSDRSAAAVAGNGAEVVRGDLRDGALLAEQARAADAVVHTALPGDASSPDVDSGVLDAVLPALAGSGTVYIHTGGVWIHGDGAGITEDTPADPPGIVAWRPAVLDRVRAAASDGAHSVVISPANVYGYGASIPSIVSGGPRTGGDEPALLFPGTGAQHVSNVYLDDVVDLYVRAISDAQPGSYLIAANDFSPTMREVAQAASRGQGLAGRVQPEPADATRGRLGPLADALALDQRVDPARAHALGWKPTGPSLLDELATGSYRTA